MYRKHIPYLFSSILLLLCCSTLTMAQNEKKVLYGVFVDNSGSMRPQIERVVDLGKGVVRQVHTDGPVAIFSFIAIDDPREAPPLVLKGTAWSQDKSWLDKYLDGLMLEGGQTTLFDAIHSIAKQMNAKANTEKDSYSRKVIVLITDGEDRKSGFKAKQLIPELKENNIQVYAIGLVQELDRDGGFIRKSTRKAAVEFLTSVTKETGGRSIFPKSNKDDVNGLLRELFATQNEPKD